MTSKSKLLQQYLSISPWGASSSLGTNNWSPVQFCHHPIPPPRSIQDKDGPGAAVYFTMHPVISLYGPLWVNLTGQICLRLFSISTSSGRQNTHYPICSIFPSLAQTSYSMVAVASYEQLERCCEWSILIAVIGLQGIMQVSVWPSKDFIEGYTPLLTYASIATALWNKCNQKDMSMEEIEM